MKNETLIENSNKLKPSVKQIVNQTILNTVHLLRDEFISLIIKMDLYSNDL